MCTTQFAFPTDFVALRSINLFSYNILKRYYLNVALQLIMLLFAHIATVLHKNTYLSARVFVIGVPLKYIGTKR